MNASVVTGMGVAFVGLLLLLFRKELVSRTVAFYQRGLLGRQRTHEIAGLVGGLFALIVGYVMAYQGHQAGLLFILAGALWVLFRKENARLNLAWYRSPKLQSVSVFLLGSLGVFVGTLLALQVIPFRP
jgi:hypothetical protein